MESEEEYKHYKYTEESSLNHPSIDRDLISSYSSYKSRSLPSQIHSDTVYNRSRSRNIKKSIASEPIRKKPAISLTEEALAIHNNEIPPQQTIYPPTIVDDNDTELIMERVDEKCRSIQLEFDEKIKQLEAQLTKAEQDYSQSRTDIEAIHLMEKEYMDEGIQTDIQNKDVEQLQQLESALQDLSLNPKEFKDQVQQWKADAEQYVHTRKIIWDAPFVPVDSICRQLPTAVHLQDIEDDDDICEYHRDRYYKVKNRLHREKDAHQQNYHATLTRLSNMIKQ
ncbi:Transcription factor [Mucor velutinosus]|uniref:Transcription factor n=1 Tax=Mucor velutinosus TaxID=708070 RepID=A0AAN7DHK0_9FUNG|nr:Transcription factor [Mucor velutinosus]